LSSGFIAFPSALGRGPGGGPSPPGIGGVGSDAGFGKTIGSLSAWPASFRQRGRLVDQTGGCCAQNEIVHSLAHLLAQIKLLFAPFFRWGCFRLSRGIERSLGSRAHVPGLKARVTPACAGG
jgi:hypothetical protein